MSLVLVLANQYGIVMTADKRLTLNPKPTPDGQALLYSSLNYQQKVFTTKSGHGIAYTGNLIADDGSPISAIIKKFLLILSASSISIQEELSALKTELKIHATSQNIIMIGAAVKNGICEVFQTTLVDDKIEEITNENGICISAIGDNKIALELMSQQQINSNCLLFSLQEGVNYLRFINATASKLQYYNGWLQSISESCDVLVINETHAQWIKSPEILS